MKIKSSRINICFNYLPYSGSTHGGAEVYLENISKAAIENSHYENINFHFVSFSDEKKTIHLENHSYVWHNLRISSHNRLIRILVEQIYLPYFCVKNKIDVLISNYVSPIFISSKKIIIIHDLIIHRYPELFEKFKKFYWKLMIPISIRFSDFVFTVSEFSKNEIINYYPQKKHKICVTTEGIKPTLSFSTPTRPKILPKDYMLCVATFGKHKNLSSLIKAFAIVTEKSNDIHLVLVGAARTKDAKKNKDELLKLSIDLSIEKKILFIDHVSDSELAYYYKNAICSVLPSLYEGFGLPIIEAQYFNCPVLCSNRASMPEIAGDAAIFFDPESIESISSAILKISTSSDLRESLIRKGSENIKNYSWENASKILIDTILKEFYKENNI